MTSNGWDWIPPEFEIYEFMIVHGCLWHNPTLISQLQCIDPAFSMETRPPWLGWLPGRSAHGAHCPLWAGSQGQGNTKKIWWNDLGKAQNCLEMILSFSTILIWNLGYVAYFKYSISSLCSSRSGLLQENNDILVRAGLGSQPSNGGEQRRKPCWLMIFGSYTTQYVRNITLPNVIISNIYYLIYFLVISPMWLAYSNGWYFLDTWTSQRNFVNDFPKVYWWIPIDSSCQWDLHQPRQASFTIRPESWLNDFAFLDCPGGLWFQRSYAVSPNRDEGCWAAEPWVFLSLVPCPVLSVLCLHCLQVANDGALEELISAIKGAGLSYKQLVYRRL